MMKPKSSYILACHIALALLCGQTHTAAAVECSDWRLRPVFDAVQENGFSVVFELTDLNGGVATGSAHYFSGPTRVEGDFTGIFDGNVLDVVVQWPNESMGHYHGYVESGGSLAGLTFDDQDPQHENHQVRWRSTQIFECARAAELREATDQLPPASGVLTPLPQLPPPSPTNPLPPAPNGARSSALQKGPDSAILFAPGGNAGVPPTAPAAPAGPAGYAVACLGGGAMSVSSGQDGFIRIGFTFAAQGSDAVAPRPGECAWHDRGFRQGEPAMLVYAASGKDANAVASAARNGGAFKVHAYNNNQGALIVTAVDGVTVASAPPPPTGGSTAFPPSFGAGVALAIVTRAVNVRAGHSTADKVIGSLPAGTPVAIASCEGSWCRLALPFGAKVGWVSKQFLQFAGSVGAPPVQ